MKKGINKQVFSLIAVFAVLAVVAVYFLWYKKVDAEAVTLEESNVVLQKTVDELKVYKINEAQYKADIDTMSKQIVDVLEKYPADCRLEDIIMQAVGIQMATKIEYTGINIGDKDVFQAVSSEAVAALGNEAYQSEIRFVGQNTSYANSLDYASLKEAVQAIFDSKYKIGITGISYYSSGDGKLDGNINMTFYSMAGNGKEYVEPYMAPYQNGTTNIFGYIPMPEETEDEEE